MLDLQAVDTQLAQLLHRRRTLPEHAEFAEIKQRREVLDERLVAVGTQVADLELEQRQAETDLDPVRARLLRNQDRIDSGAVPDPKALTAMVEEVEHLKRRISNLEDAELEIMQALETAQSDHDALAESRAGIDAELSTVIDRRDEQVREIDARAVELKTERTGLVKLLPELLLARYDKARASHAGLGAAALRQRRCTGCQLEANASDLRNYAAAAPDEVLSCEECGRILVRTSESGLPKV